MAEVEFNSILEDPAYKTNAMNWMAIQVAENRGTIPRFIHPVEHFKVQKLLDTLANKSFEALRKDPRVIGLRLTGSFAGGLQKPEFNLIECAAVYDAEPLVKKAITRQVNLWFKQGFQFIGEDIKLTDYIRKRFKTIAYVTGIPTLELFKTIVRSLLKFQNAFVIKVRSTTMSPGISANGKAPVAGYFPVSCLNMFPYFENGKLTKWIRFVKDGTRRQEFSVDDVIHFTFDREEEYVFGKPRMLGVIEDVAALRRIEENVEVLMAKFLFPIYQLQVGTEKVPARYYPDGTSEIDMARMMVQNMEQEGMLITSERYKLDVVGTLKEALHAENYLKHFQDRLFAGLGVSSVDMGFGDTANRSTADNISQNLKDLVIEDQRTFAAQVQQSMFGELFLEHPDHISALNAFDSVSLRFANVDLDNLIKLENHVINLWNNDLVNESEARILLGKDPFSPEEKALTHFHQMEYPLAIIMARDEPYTAVAKAAIMAKAKKDLGAARQSALGMAPGTGGSSAARKGAAGRIRVKRPGSAASRPVAVASQPTNQYGTNPGPTKAKSSVERDLIGTRLMNLVNRIILARNNDELEQAIIDRFPRIIDQAHILPIVENALKVASPTDLRAHLVTGFMEIRHLIPESENEGAADASQNS